MNKERLYPEDYLRQPYTRSIIPDEESGTFTAKIEEFPGCVAQGDTAEEAYKNLENAARGWIEAALDLGQEIPSPLIDHEYSGKFALRLPKSLHRQASLAAGREGVSLNQFILYAVSEKMGALNLYGEIARKVTETLEVHQHSFKTAVSTAVEQIEYAIQELGDTSQSETMIGPIIMFGGREGRMH